MAKQNDKKNSENLAIREIGKKMAKFDKKWQKKFGKNM